MPLSILIATLLVLSLLGYLMGRRRAMVRSNGLQVTTAAKFHSVPSYYGLYVAIWCAVPALILLIAWIALEPLLIRTLVLDALPLAATAGKSPAALTLYYVDIVNVASGVFPAPDQTLADAAAHLNQLRALSGWALFVIALVIALAGLAYARRRIAPTLRARNWVEKAVTVFMVLCSILAIVTTLGIILSLLFESLRFFARVSPVEFLFGTHWSPQTAIREDQVGSSGAFGAVPLFTGTMLISAVALLVAVPLGLLSAIYMADYAPRRVRGAVKPILEILAGVPTVVYGFFAILTVAPFLRDSGAFLGLSLSSNSALAAGLVMGIMIVPFVSSLSDDVINAVPQSLRDGSAALGATKSETVRQVILPAALPGIIGAILLAASRAIGETMIVVMAAGLAANLTANPFEAVTTVTVQIATLLVGDQEFDSAKTLSAFALGLVLFAVTLALNFIALRVVQKYREKYD